MIMPDGYNLIKCDCPVCGKPSDGFEDAQGQVALKCWTCTLDYEGNHEAE